MESRPSLRRYDLDWLRVFATWMLFPFHAGKVFDIPPFYSIKNGELSSAMGFFTGFVHQWHMPLFFLLAGWSAYASIGARGAAGFTRERLQRLLLPLVFGVLALCPPIRWVELREGMFITASGAMLPAEPGVGFLAFLPRYYTAGGVTWSHLWFLAYLFTFSLLYLPLLAPLARRPAPGGEPRAIWVWAALLPIVLVQLTLRERWPGLQNLVDDWANFAYYSLFFLFGFALSRRPALERAVQRAGPRAGLLALAALLGMVLCDVLRAHGVSQAIVANRALSALAGFGAVAWLLGFASRRLAFSNRALAYLAASALPIYILHQLFLVYGAVLVTRLPLGIAAKFALLVPLSAAATLAAYHFLVRPFPPLRFLLGMKTRSSLKPRPAGARAPGAVAAVALLALLVACDAPAPPVSSAVGGWPVYGADDGGTRFSPLDDITPQNVDRLEIAWTYRHGDVVEHGTARNPRWKTSFQATPILDADTLYFPTPLGRVIALDAETGTERWSFDTKLPRDVGYSESTSRGVALWHDANADEADAPCARRIFYATLDARLFALDAARGTPCPDFAQGGSTDLRRDLGDPEPREYMVTSPPVVIGDAVVVGSAISDNQRAAAPRGVVRAFDARTGALRWRFDPIPTDPQDPAASSWEDGSSARTGAANAWSILSVDAERDLVFVPTGSASPDYYGGERRGANRHANSVVALRGTTGALVWSFQAVHHDLWDYDVPAQPVLVALRRDGVEIPALVQATKMGFLFVLQRETGAPLNKVMERAVPASDVPGEVASPTQPFPSWPPPLAPSALRPEDAFGLTPWDRAKCRDRIAALRNDGLFTPPSLGGSLEFPGISGGVNWGSVAFDAGRGLVFANTSRIAFHVRLVPRDRFEAERAAGRGNPLLEFAPQAGTPYGMVRGPILSPLGIPCNPPPWGTLAAVDLATGTVRWESTLGTTRDLTPLPVSLGWGTPNLGGPMATAGGLVFIGAAMDDYLRAFDAETGAELWKGRLPAGGQATPMTYKLRPGGRQFVVIAAGGHGKLGTKLGDTLIAFALPAE